MKRTYSMNLFLFFISCVSLNAQTVENDFTTIASRAIRPDFPVSCSDCCNDAAAENSCLLKLCDPIFINAVPYVINSPGVYVLCQNIYYLGTSDAAIFIDTSVDGDVVLDFAQHALVGQGFDTAIQITGYAGTVFLKNGTISEFDFGLKISANNVSIKNMKISEINQAAVYAQSSDNLSIYGIETKNIDLVGIQLVDVSNVSIANATIEQGDTGLLCSYISSAFIEDVRVLDAGVYGCHVIGNASDVVFSRCVLDKCEIGVYLEQSFLAGESVSGICFFDTIVTGSFNTGVVINVLNNTLFKSVLFKDCQIIQSQKDGCYIENGIGHIFENCNILNSGRFGLYLRNGSSHILKNCNISFNGYNADGIPDIGGMYIDLCERCQVYDSVLSNNFHDAVYLLNSGRFVIQNSYLCNNGFGGIFMNQTIGVENTRVINCTICSNGLTGVFCANSNTLVERCTISENLTGINVPSTSIDCQILNNWVANNISRGIINDTPTSYIWGNTSAKNAINFGGSFQPLNIAPSSTSPYWANIRI